MALPPFSRRHRRNRNVNDQREQGHEHRFGRHEDVQVPALMPGA